LIPAFQAGPPGLAGGANIEPDEDGGGLIDGDWTGSSGFLSSICL